MKIYPVILSGGAGTRLWPLSRAVMPKQLLPLVGEKMVLLDTAAAINVEGRLTGWCVEEQIYIQADRHGEWVTESPARADVA